MYGRINVVSQDATEKRFTINYGSKSSCDYVIAIHVLFGVLYALAMAVLHLTVMIKRMRKSDIE